MNYIHDIIYTYRNALGRYAMYIDIQSIHKNKDICFHTMMREIVYAIRNCFKEQGIHTEIREKYRIFISIPVAIIPIIPPFSSIHRYYKKAYFDRLNLLEYYARNKNISYQELHNERILLDKDTTIVGYLPFPKEILSIIATYLRIDFNHYYNLRNKYQKLRYKLIT